MAYFLAGLLVGLVLGGGAVYVFAALGKKAAEKVTGL